MATADQISIFFVHGQLVCNKAHETGATLLANNTQHCLGQRVASVCMEPPVGTCCV